MKESLPKETNGMPSRRKAGGSAILVDAMRSAVCSLFVPWSPQFLHVDFLLHTPESSNTRFTPKPDSDFPEISGLWYVD
jgi:hypothetical protein